MTKPEPEIEHDIVVKMPPRETIPCQIVLDTEYEKLITRLAKLEIENGKLKADNLQLTITSGQLRERNAQLESERDQPVVDVVQVLKENEQLRQQIRKLEIAALHSYRNCWCAVVPKRKYTKKARLCSRLVAEKKKLRDENEQLRKGKSQALATIAQVVEQAEQLATDLMQVAGELGKRE